MAYALGVDLGTTYTAAAVWRDDQFRMVDLGPRGLAMPSVVFAGEDGVVLVGDAADRRSGPDPERIARAFKRRLGDPTPVVLGGVPYSVEALTASLLRATLDQVTTLEGEAPAIVCATRPANWGPYRTEVFSSVLGLAGAPSAFTTTEPEAAAWWHARHERVDVGAALAVYDLGGGTFDAVVLRKTEEGFEVLGEPRGLEHLGGVDFDAALLGLVDEALDGALSALDPGDRGAQLTMARLRADVTEAKEALSSDVVAAIPVLLPSGWSEVRVTRADLEARIEPLVRQTVDVLGAAIDDAGLAPADLAKVLLVGGSSRAPLVARMVEARLGVRAAIDDHPKHTVALGAVLQAAGALATGVVPRPRAAAGAPPPAASPPAAPPPVRAETPAAELPAAPPPPAPPSPPGAPPPRLEEEAPQAARQPSPVSGPVTGARRGPALTGPALVFVAGPEGGRLVPLPEGRVAIGRDPADGGVQLRDRHASRTHAWLEVSGDDVVITDAGSLNGTFVDGAPAPSAELVAGQSVRIGASLAVLVDRSSARAGSATATLAAPWARSAADGDLAPLRVVLPVPATRPRGVLRRRAGPEASYADELEALASDVAGRHRAAMALRRQRHPTAALSLAVPPTRLRTGRSEDFLVVAVGYGDQPAELPIEIPDELGRRERREAERLVARFDTDHDVPLLVDLGRDRVLDVVAAGRTAVHVVNQLMAQLALLHEPGDLAFAALGGGGDPTWRWLARFPHAEGRDGRPLVDGGGELVERLRLERRGRTIVVVASRDAPAVDLLTTYCADADLVMVRYGERLPADEAGAVRVEADPDTALAVLHHPGSGEVVEDVMPATLGDAAVSELAAGPPPPP